MDDRELWHRIRGRDSDAFEAFYRAYGPGLRGVLKQLLGTPQAAEDVTQEGKYLDHIPALAYRPQENSGSQPQRILGGCAGTASRQ